VRQSILKTLLLTLLVSTAMADDDKKMETLSVFGSKETLPTRPGSAHVVTQEEIEKFELGDIHRILRSVPGVNIQEEDGFGLRPNIGLRGAHPHRSKSISLMEDGVLIAPAPYAAPAAYYFPLMDKIGSIEVFKGVPSTKFGPSSIGGALNLITRVNPKGVEIGTSQGGFGFQKYDASIGFEAFGDWTIDATRMSSTGFKTVQGRDDTGFERHNVMLRWDKYFTPMDQNLTLKLNWSNEISNETYAGVAEQDFEVDPLRRYSSTALDQMLWNHRQAFINYAFSPVDALRIKTTGYYHEQDRTWFKLNGFYNQGVTPPSMLEMLKNPNFAANEPYYLVFSGRGNSGNLSGNRDVLDLGNNDRRYYSRGAQIQMDYELEGFERAHLFLLSYRRHSDGARRDHDSTYFNMLNGQLQRNNTLPMFNSVFNESLAAANTFVLSYESQGDRLNYNATLRYEDIDFTQINHLLGTTQETENHFLAPGVGLFYQLSDQWGVLAGVNKGFTPTGPGQGPEIEPGEAINYELGFRYTGRVSAEIIGFYSDYSNLLGTCTLSNGCDPSQIGISFNGGAAEIKGVEFLAHHDFNSGSFKFPVRLSATYTEASFQSNFTSNLAEWGIGDVRVGDPVPYIPRWQGQLSLGLNHKKFFSEISFQYLSEMFDQAVALDRVTISDRTVTNLVLGYNLTEAATIRLRVDNLLDERYVVSLLPFGRRPGMPRNFILGVTYAFR
jgi:Fe(3+) dicitrate transport protein